MSRRKETEKILEWHAWGHYHNALDRAYRRELAAEYAQRRDLHPEKWGYKEVKSVQDS